MAERTQPEDSAVAEDPLVASLVPDPSQGPVNAAVLAGYIGRGAEEGVWRLYLTPSLNEYVEVRKDEVLHRESLPDEGGTQIWVRDDLNVRYVRSTAQRVPAGQIGRAYRRTLPASPRTRPAGGWTGARAHTVADALPFALATAHHALEQPWGTVGIKSLSEPKKRRDDRPVFPWGDPGDILHPLTMQYERLLTDYLDLVAAYEELRQPPG
jgi:hypothetical protein